MHPRLTLAVLAKPVSEKVLAAIGLAERKPFYTVDFPYLWGRVRRGPLHRVGRGPGAITG